MQKKMLGILLVVLVLVVVVVGLVILPREQESPEEPVVEEPVVEEPVEEEPVVEEPVVEEPVTEPEVEVTTIRFWQAGGDTAGAPEQMAKIIESFEAANPNIKIDYMAVPWAERPHDKFQLAIVGGDVADLLLVGAPFDKTLADIGAIVPLDEFVDEPLRRDLRDIYVDRGIYRGRFAELQGKLISLPMYAGTRVIVYNRELLKAAGISEPTVAEPWSFDEFKQNAIALTKDTDGDGTTDQFGFGTSARFMSQFLPFIWSKGGEILNPEMTAAMVNTPEWKAALEYYIDLLHRVSPPGSVNIPLADIQKMFGAGQVAMFVTTIDFVMELIKDPVVKERTAVAPMPHYNGKQANFLGTDVFVITRQSNYPEKAWKFLRYLLSPENQMAYCKVVGFMPVLKTVSNDPFFTEDPFRMPFIQALEYGRFFVQSGRAPAITTVMRAELQQAVEGVKSIEEALIDMEKGINIALQ